MKNLRQIDPLALYLLLMLMMWLGSCNSISTTTSIASNSYLMSKQRKALYLLYEVTGVTLDPVPITYDASMSDRLIAQEVLFGTKPGIRFNPDYQWTESELVFIILHEHGHIQGLSHSGGIMISHSYPNFGQLFEDHQDQLLTRFANQLDQHNQGSTATH
jgi:hypothetical protein